MGAVSNVILLIVAHAVVLIYVLLAAIIFSFQMEHVLPKFVKLDINRHLAMVFVCHVILAALHVQTRFAQPVFHHFICLMECVMPVLVFVFNAHVQTLARLLKNLVL